jgi:hypothetical protein
MHTETHEYRGYQIQITQHPPVWQAAIYPTTPNMLAIDWELRPISAANIHGALIEARRRIDSALAAA